MALSLLALALCASVPVWTAVVPQASTHRSISFDYVIVGGGTAGLTLANRLSEDSSVTVAVIEGGTFVEQVAGNLSAVPAYSGTLETVSDNDTNVGWGFETTPQPVCNSPEPEDNTTDLVVGISRCRRRLCTGQSGV